MLMRACAERSVALEASHVELYSSQFVIAGACGPNSAQSQGLLGRLG